MTLPTRIERDLPAILDSLSTAPVPDYLDDVFGQTGRMRQRPAWTFPERWIPMAEVARLRAVAPAPPWRLIALGLLVIALIAAALLAVGAQRRPAPPFGPANNGGIAYVSKGDVYVGDPATGSARLIVGGPETDSGPGFSPDGTRLAFLREVGCCPQRFDLYVARDDGGGPRKVGDASFTDQAWINWTPDSRHFAVIDAKRSGNHLEIFDADGREAPRLLAPQMEIESVTFRPPDGREIAFRTLIDHEWGMYVMNADGTNIRPLREPTVPEAMNSHAANMVYSADGQRLFYQSYAKAANGDEGCCQLWVMNADGSDAHRFVGEDGAWAGVPSVSPDGAWVSFWYAADGEPQRVRVTAADGRGPVIETGPEMPDFAWWVWSPDSSKILLSAANGSDSAYILDPEGGPYDTVPWGAEMDWQRLAP